MRLFLLVALGFVAFAAFGGWAERLILYPFDPRQVAPVDAGLTGVNEQIVQVNDEALVVWTTPAKSGKPTVLYFHGNAGNLASRAGRFRRFMNRGYGIVAPAYRGSSGSPGSPNEEALILDARRIYQMLRAGDLEVPLSGALVAYGESLGTAVTIALANDPDTVLDAVILEAPFASLQALAEHHYPSVATLADTFDNQWPSEALAATALDMPLLVMHGTEDELIPYAQGKAIFDAAPSTAKTMLSVKDAGHTDLWRSDTLPKLWRFIDQH